MSDLIDLSEIAGTLTRAYVHVPYIVPIEYFHTSMVLCLHDTGPDAPWMFCSTLVAYHLGPRCNLTQVLQYIVYNH